MVANKSALSSLWPNISDAFAGVTVSNITLDSREIKGGDLFIALKGLHHDARDFIGKVIEQGASAVFAEQDNHFCADKVINNVPVIVIPELSKRVGEIAARFYGEPSQKMTVLAVTGTNGKTSVANLLAAALAQLNKSSAILGTVGNGLFGQLGKATHTTPDAVRLQKYFSEFLGAGAQFVAMEASSHGLEQGRMSGTHIHTALFTNLSRDHLDYHGTMDAYAQAKAILFQWPELKAAVLNADDERYDEFKAVLSQSVRLISYSTKTNSSAELVAKEIRPSLSGLVLRVAFKSEEAVLNSALMGRFNASNLLAVMAGLISVGFTLRDAVLALENVVPVPGRMECIQGNGATVIVDYAHTPDALEKVLSSLREHTSGQLWCVFGCGGDRDTGKRPQMAAVAERLADKVIITSDNPRTENPEVIIADVVAGLTSIGAARIEMDRHQAIEFAVTAAADNDIVVIAGKGHEDYQEINGVRHAFSDRAEVEAALQKRQEAV